MLIHEKSPFLFITFLIYFYPGHFINRKTHIYIVDSGGGGETGTTLPFNCLSLTLLLYYEQLWGKG